MQVNILNYGATLEKVLLNQENMILTLNSPEDYSKERNFLGGTVGRICGRVAFSKFWSPFGVKFCFTHFWGCAMMWQTNQSL